MRILSISRAITFLCTLAIMTHFVGAQSKITTEEQLKLATANQAATQFVNRFRQTLDFSVVWNEFKARDTRCAYRLSPGLPSYSEIDTRQKPLEQRLSELGFDEAFLQSSYIQGWNSALIFESYVYSYSPWNGREPDVEKTRVPKGRGGRQIFKVLKQIESDEDSGSDDRPITRKEMEGSLARSRESTKILRRYMPPDFLKTRDWYLAKKWFGEVHDVGNQVRDRTDFNHWCPWLTPGKLYVSQVGFFVLVFTEENGKMKLWSLSYVDD